MNHNSVLKYLLKSSPEVSFKMLSLKQEMKYPYFVEMDEAFSKTKRIDVFPLGSQEGKGFMLVLDREVALYFCVKNNQFIYDGFEVGCFLAGGTGVFKLSTTAG